MCCQADIFAGRGQGGEWWGAWDLSLSLISSCVCRAVLQYFLEVIHDEDDPVKEKTHSFLWTFLFSNV